MPTVAERLTTLLAHRRVGDPESDALLDAMIGGASDAMGRLGLAAFGDPDSGATGVQVLRDPRYAPLWALPHAALYTGGIVPGRTVNGGEPINLVLNPSAEIDLTDISSEGGQAPTIARDDAWSSRGDWAVHATRVATAATTCSITFQCSTDFEVGETYTVAADVHSVTGELVHVDLWAKRADNTSVLLATSPNATDGRLRAVGVVPADAVSIRARVTITTPPSGTAEFFADGCVVIKGDVPGDYFDGDSTSARWQGVRGDSPSETLVPESDDDYLARARDAVVYPLGIKRGTHEAILRVVQPLLTGTKTVIIEDGYITPYGILVRTIASETPDPVAVQAAIEGDYVSSGRRGAMRAELVLTYLTDDVVTFGEADDNFTDLDPSVTALNVTRSDVTA